MRFTFLLVSAALLACASSGQVAARWVDADGTPADPEALAAAEQTCRSRVEQELAPDRRFQHIAWGRAMRQCMTEQGFELVAVPDEDAR